MFLYQTPAKYEVLLVLQAKGDILKLLLSEEWGDYTIQP